MYKKLKILLYLVTSIGFIAGTSLPAQEVISKETVSDSTALENMKIPPLGLLIESAQTFSPLLKEQTAMILMREFQIKSANYDWGRYLLFFSEFRYGTVDVLVGTQSQISVRPIGSAYYNFGTRLQLSVFDALDLKQKRNVTKSMLTYEVQKREDLKRMIQDDVIRLWNKLVSYREILLINEDHVAAQNDNIFFAEQQFKAGDIPLVEYARIKEISIKAQQEYQLGKKEYREAYYLLESLVGRDFKTLDPKR
jgi:outer membrane protein TolC